MSAVIVQIADAIAAQIVAHDFGVTFTTERSYADWDLELESATPLRVDVVPVRHESSELETYDSTRYQCSVDIGIRQRFGTESQVEATGRVDPAQVDALVLLVEQMHEFFCSPAQRRLATYDAAAWVETKIRETFVRKHLHDLRQFTGLIRVTYEASQAIA